MNRRIARAGAILTGSLLLTACSGSVIPVPTQGPAPSGSLCMLARGSGRLVADARWGIALDDPAGFVREVIWPYGYAARQDARVVLLNEAGEIVAGEGDQVAITGGETGSNGPWLACGSIGSIDIRSD
jgi:hypothetical protein